jgi:sec-independent protein translocase protein TatA
MTLHDLLPPLAYAWSPTYLIIILVVVVLLFGGAKIPELMRGMGKGMGEFKKGLKEGKEDEDDRPRGDDLATRQKAIEARKLELAREEEELAKLKAKSRD